tara:strand:- start:309 stop:473 length:165 start_codon:yes stop_codon:yes gene_type:complete
VLAVKKVPLLIKEVKGLLIKLNAVPSPIVIPLATSSVLSVSVNETSLVADVLIE